MSLTPEQQDTFWKFFDDTEIAHCAYAYVERLILEARLDEQYREHVHTYQASNNVHDGRCRMCWEDFWHITHLRIDDPRLKDLRGFSRIKELESEPKKVKDVDK